MERYEEYLEGMCVHPGGKYVTWEDHAAEVEKLKSELRYVQDTYASNQFAYADMKKYAYRVGHKDECFTLGQELKQARKEVEKLRAVLSDISSIIFLLRRPCHFCDEQMEEMPCTCRDYDVATELEEMYKKSLKAIGEVK